MASSERAPAAVDPVAAATADAVRRFNEAFNRHDVDAVMACMTPDCAFENTFPAPDGERFEGAAAVRGFWERFFQSTPAARFETEELFQLVDKPADHRQALGPEGRVTGIQAERGQQFAVA